MDHISCPPGSTDGASANEPSSHVTTESATAPATADDAESPHRSSKPPKLRIKIRSPKREQHEAKDPANGVQDSSSTPSPSPHHVTGSEITQEGGNWLCTKCINNNAAKRIRCWFCKGWKVRICMHISRVSCALVNASAMTRLHCHFKLPVISSSVSNREASARTFILPDAKRPKKTRRNWPLPFWIWSLTNITTWKWRTAMPTSLPTHLLILLESKEPKRRARTTMTTTCQ